MSVDVQTMQQLSRDLDERYERGEFFEGRGMRNGYTCADCKITTMAILRDSGTTPMWLTCTHCGGEATSLGYRLPDYAYNYPVFHQFYRPSSDEEIRRALAADASGETAAHLERGGLLFGRLEV